MVLKSVPLGTYCRNNPLAFSFAPRCQEAYGSAKYAAIHGVRIPATVHNEIPAPVPN